MLSETQDIEFSGEKTNSPTPTSSMAELLAKYIQRRMKNMNGSLVAINYTLREWRNRTNVSDKMFGAVIRYLQTYWDYGKYVECTLIRE